MIIEFSPTIILEEWENNPTSCSRYNRFLNKGDDDKLYITLIYWDNYYNVQFWEQLYYLNNYYKQSYDIGDPEETKDYVDQFLLQMAKFRAFL